MIADTATPTKSDRKHKSKLDDAETIILVAAANREDGIALPAPDSIRAPAEQVTRKIKRLIKLALLEEVPAKLEDGLWRKSEDDRHLTLKITPLASQVLDLAVLNGMNPEDGEQSAGSGEVEASAMAPASKKTAKRPTSRDKRKKAPLPKPA